jgi:acetyl esterase/lipase
MPLDPHVARFLDRLAALNPPSALSLSVAERRAALAQLLSFSGAAVEVSGIENRVLPGPGGPLAVRIYTPSATATTSAGLIYFHGGGFVAGNLDTHDGICRLLTASSGARVVSVDYRLAPEHRFPAAVDDGHAAIEWIAGHAGEFGLDAGRLGVCGDSAGATLAAVLCQRVAAEGRVRLALQFLLCPIMDFVPRTESRRAFTEGYLVDEATLAHDIRHYLQPDTSLADTRVSPLQASDLVALPPTCIHTAEFDLLRDEGRMYAERLERAGVTTRYRCHSGMIHLFYGMGGLIPYVPKAWQLIGADIRSLLSPG